MDEEQTKTAATGTDTGATGAPLSGMLGALLSNPELIKQMSGIVAAAAKGNADTATANIAGTKDSSEAPVSSDAESTPVSASPSPSVPSPDALSAMLSDPAMLEKLPQILAVMKPLLASASPAQKPQEVQKAVQDSPAMCRDNLLLALKPFLSSTRRDAVDQMIRIAKLGSLMGMLK